MTRKLPHDLSASVAARLLQYAKGSGDDFQYVLMRFGLERLMYRLSLSAYREQFVVKGAMLFLVWGGAPYRPTKDLDLMTAKTLTPTELADIFRAVCVVEAADDGLVFKPESVKAEEIREDNVYGGLRVTLMAMLGRSRIPIQVDIGFGDAVTPGVVTGAFPVVLDFPAPTLSMYPRETVVAEKYEAMVKLGMANSRMKDYFDVWIMTWDFEFDGELLKQAIAATFRRRRTLLPDGAPDGLSAEFAGDPGKNVQWRAFVGRSRVRLAEAKLHGVVETVRKFLMPVSEAARTALPFPMAWPKGGPWEKTGQRSRES